MRAAPFPTWSNLGGTERRRLHEPTVPQPADQHRIVKIMLADLDDAARTHRDPNMRYQVEELRKTLSRLMIIPGPGGQ
jgi:hypothetical protein